MVVGLPMREELGVGGGHDGFDGFVDGFGDAFGFVDDEEEVGGVEALELVGGVGGEAEGVAVGGEFPAGVVELAAEGFGVAAVEVMDLAPEDVADLAEGGGGGEGDGGLVGVEEPEEGDGGGEAFAEAVAGFYGDALVVGDSVEDFFLLFPRADV